MTAMVGVADGSRPDAGAKEHGPISGIVGFLVVALFFYVILDGPFRRKK